MVKRDDERSVIEGAEPRVDLVQRDQFDVDEVVLERGQDRCWEVLVEGRLLARLLLRAIGLRLRPPLAGCSPSLTAALAAAFPRAPSGRIATAERRITDRCRVAVCAAPPSEADADARVFTELIVVHGEYEQGLGQLILTAEPEWAGASVVVWSYIDVGFAQMLSRPHLLGRMAVGGRRARG